MWSNKEADFFPEINKSFTFPGMGHICVITSFLTLEEAVTVAQFGTQ